jgi:hypothetical protein
MDEAHERFSVAHYSPRRRARRKRSRGQAIVEFLLVLFLSLFFLRFVFFNREYGIKAQLDNTMLRLGVFLEANLKTGTKLGGDGTESIDPYAGTSRWSN